MQQQARAADASDEVGVLAELGLSGMEERLYLSLLGLPPATEHALADSLEVALDDIRRAVAALDRRGLINRSAESEPRLSVAPPELALEVLVRDRERALAQIRAEIPDLAAQARNASAEEDAGRAPVELTRGRDATRQRWVQVQRAALAEVRIIDRPPYVMPGSVPNEEEMDLLYRGIGYRVLYTAASLDIPGKLNIVMKCIAAGERARVINDAPIKLILADTRLGLTYDIQDTIDNCILVRPSPLLEALSELFERLWKQATPLELDNAPSSGPAFDAQDLAILAQLASGAKDEAIARRLGMGLRTVRRRIANLMDELGAATRFQAGFQAAHARLLHTDEPRSIDA